MVTITITAAIKRQMREARDLWTAIRTEREGLEAAGYDGTGVLKTDEQVAASQAVQVAERRFATAERKLVKALGLQSDDLRTGAGGRGRTASQKLWALVARLDAEERL
jgi:predicted S18 family serine protease